MKDDYLFWSGLPIPCHSPHSCCWVQDVVSWPPWMSPRRIRLCRSVVSVGESEGVEHKPMLRYSGGTHSVSVFSKPTNILFHLYLRNQIMVRHFKGPCRICNCSMKQGTVSPWSTAAHCFRVLQVFPTMSDCESRTPSEHTASCSQDVVEGGFREGSVDWPSGSELIFSLMTCWYVS